MNGGLRLGGALAVALLFYAPDAYGAEFIVIRDGSSLTDEQLTHLTGPLSLILTWSV